MQKIYADDFHSMDNYWIEGGEDAWVAENRLYQKANPPDKSGAGVSTIWCKTKFPENVEIHVHACVIESVIGANNINLFLSYSDTVNRSLFETRHERTDGDYTHYHALNGYIFTFLRDWQRTQKDKAMEDEPEARYRMRRCPGFHLMTEKYGDKNEAGVVYLLTIRKYHEVLSFAVNGNTILEGKDPTPLTGGAFGFRTFHTFLWWSGLEVYEL